MRAEVYHGAHDVRVENVPDPQILNEREAIVKATATAPHQRRAAENGNIRGRETVAIWGCGPVVRHNPPRLALDDAPHGYDLFRKKEDGCFKVVMKS